MSKKIRFLSFVLAVVMLFSSAPIVPANAQEEESLSVGMTNPFRNDVSFTVGGQSVTSNSYRIPSMVTLADGTIVAAADIRWNTTYDGGGLDTLVARSTDGGKSWTYNVANYLGDNGNEYNSKSTTFIDPNLLVAADGMTIYMLVDLYAYGVALNGDGSHIQPVADTGFDTNGNLKLSNDNHSSYNYYLKDGKIYDSSNNVVEGYEIDAYFNITYTQDGEIKKSNLFYYDSPFKVVRTQYLYLTKSTDGGATWSEPNLLDVRAKAKVAATENALLVSPGNSITTSGGIMVYPVYSYKTDGTQHVALIYSIDGVDWERSADYTALNWSSEGAIVELENGNLRVFVRNKTGYLCYVDFDMNTMSWIGHAQTTVPTNSNTQLSAITYSKTSNGDQVVLVSCPTGPNGAGSANNDGSFRTNGKIHVFTVSADGKMNLEKTIDVFDNLATDRLSGSDYTEENGFFAYSALTELANGSVALLYENNQFGWGAGAGKYYTIDIKGYNSSALGIKLDRSETIIVDNNGNFVDSVTVSQTEKAELTANLLLATADVDYQWQIEYEDDKWVDIYGEDEKTIKLSFGMVATLLNGDGKVGIRCKTTAGSLVAYSNYITVTAEMYQPKEPEESNVVVSESFVSSNGETVMVTVVGSLPENADVELAETDSTGVDVKPSETVVAALDISIKNADGSQWQPESGETVTVTLEASKLGLENGKEFVVYHLHGDEVRILGSYKVVNDTISFEVDGFSKFVFTFVEMTTDTDDLLGDIEKTATVNTNYNSTLWMVENPASLTSYNGKWYMEAKEGVDYAAGIEFIITNVYVTDVYPYGIFYEVKAVNEEDLLTTILTDNPWVFFRYQDEPDDYNALILQEVPQLEIPEAPNLSSDIGKHAHLTQSDDVFIMVMGEEPDVGYSEASWIYDATQFSTDFTVQIDGYKVVSEINKVTDEETGKLTGYAVRQSLWYQVSVVEGNCDDEFQNGWWIFQNYITEGEAYENDTFTLFDAPEQPENPEEPTIGVTVDGETVTEITVDAMTKVTVTALATFETADIDYKWQACYDVENDLWVDITGEDEAEISVSAGMVMSLVDENNQVRVRCVVTAGSQTLTSDPILVTLRVEEPDGEEEPKLEILLDGESADSVDVNDAEKDSFASVLSASTNLPAELTYTWEVLYNPDYGMWKTLSEEAALAPVFSSSATGTYIGNANYVHSSAITIRLTVTDGVTTLTDTFVINLKSEEAAPAVYSRMMRSVSSSSSDSGVATAAETTTTYNVIINYLDENGENVLADPYTSVVSPTTILTNTISFPKVPGYEPHVYKNGNWVRQDTYTFNGKPFSSDFTLEVRYFPGQVEYKVNVYIQNAENDEYVLLDSFTDTELTGTVLDEIEFTIPGYYQSKFSSNNAEIAADGSTEFNLYYDRIYYLMKFDLDGGYGVQPIYARHGVKLDIPNPAKAGYTFVGWDQTAGIPAVSNELLNDGIANTMYEYMPIGATAYKAIWKAVDNAKVTIVYWGENPNDEKYSYLESQEIYVKPGTELTFGTDQLVCTLTPHQHDTGCTYNCDITPHTHTVEAGCYKLTCTIETHNHTESGCQLTNCTYSSHVHDSLNCYSVQYGNLVTTNAPNVNNLDNWQHVGDNIYTYTTEESYWGYTYEQIHYLVKIGETWYRGSYGDTTNISLSCTHTHTDACYDCGLVATTHEHTLNNGCYTLTCTTEAHTHSDKCYSCVAHTHNDDCYLKTTNQNSNLWTYVRSDTVTVAADGSTVMNVYYDRVEYNVEFHSNQNCTNEYTNLRITAKWGASILDKWPAYNGSSSWLVEDKSNTWQNSIQIMPIGGAKFWGPKTGNSSYKAYYYVEALPGDTDTITHNGVTYKLHHTDVSVSSGNVTDEERYGIEGFTYKEGTSNGTSYNNAKFYYARSVYQLEFNNGEEIVKTQNVKYQYSLSPYDFTPAAPSYYEAGSVVFDGWYQNPECTGEEVKLDGMTMPSHNVLLYAKWVPVKHDVTVYRYRDANGTLHDLLCNHTDEAIGNAQGLGAISHGELLNKHYTPEKPTNGNYTFVTWAYYDEDMDEEIPIDINSFVVTEDVEIYAVWSSNVQVPYTIKYMIQGTTTEIAAPSEGKHYAGETHTFNAKTAGQLNAGYQTGYFPVVTSHSIDFKEDGGTDYNEATGAYEYTFYYVQKNAVPYTVYYVTEQPKEGDTLDTVVIKESGVDKTYYVVAHTKQVDDNVNAIVTENFKTVTGYMPDAYQKTLIIDGSDGAVNQIIFKYSVDTQHAYYKVTHWTEQTDGSWFAHATNSRVGTIGDRISESPMDITGFTYSETKYVVKGSVITEGVTDGGAILTEDGLEINLYYTRNKYPYTVQYVLEGTDTVLYTETFEDQYYGATVSHKAPLYWETGDVYERISAETLYATIQTDTSKNLITFYYEEQEVTIKYEVANGFGGTVNPSQETVLVKSGDAEGSVAAPLSSAYKFVGWYDKVGKQLSTDLEFVPEKVNGLNIAATYYAKFEYNLTSLTIVKDGAEDYKDIDPNQTFIFNIKGNGVDLDVTVHTDGNGNWSTTIDGLTVGAMYTITEKTNWSWRYSCTGWTHSVGGASDSGQGNTAIITLGLDGAITFANTHGNEQWLDGDSWCNNLFK